MKKTILLFISIFMVVSMKAQTIAVDGNMSDWAEVPVLSEPGVFPYAKVHVTSSSIFYHVGYETGAFSFNPSAWNIVDVYIDADNDGSTGYGQWVATYDVLYTPYTSGSTTTILSDQPANLGVAGSKAGQYEIEIPATNFTNDGKYEIRITNLTDRISRKSLDLISAIAGTDIPQPNDLYTVHIFPTPTTKKLQHVKNMP